MTDSNPRPKTSRGTIILLWIIAAAVVIGGVYFLFVKPAFDDQGSDEMYCDMLYTYGTAGYDRCVGN